MSHLDLACFGGIASMCCTACCSQAVPAQTVDELEATGCVVNLHSSPAL